MKRIFILLTFASVLSLPACSLKEDTSSLSTPENSFRTYSECEAVVNGCYIPLKSIYTFTYMIITECQTDISRIYSGTLDARLDVSPAIPRFGATVWTQGYLGVQRCNFAIQGIEKSPGLGESQRDRLLCEAKALRAMYYYTLTCMFGNVPFYFDDVKDHETMDRIATLPRMCAVQTRKACIEDLLEIAPKVPQTRTSDNTGARLGASAAWMLIGKMALWNATKDDPARRTFWYETAVGALEHLETIYGDLSAYDYGENVTFRNKNTPESILEIQHIYVRGGMVYTSNVACICTPVCRRITNEQGIVIGATFDGVEIPELGHECTTWTAMRPNTYFSQGLQTKLGKDIRKQYNMAWEYNGKAFSDVNTTPWPGPKFWCPGMVTTQDGNNYKVFRYADALLMLSECWFYLGDNDKSIAYLNKIRARAQTGDYVYRTQARLEDEIRCERARELYGEFQRKFDLVRWGIWYTAVQENSDHMPMKEAARPCHEYYPIPDKEVTYSKFNLDNNEYKKYGL